MKKLALLTGAILISAAAMAHDQFMYTENLDVTGKDAIKVKIMMGHPDEGKEEGGVDVGTVEGKTTLPKKVFVVHNGEKTDLTKMVKIGKINTDKNDAVTFDFDFTRNEGLKGGGSWVFFAEPGETRDEGYSFFNATKMVIHKDNIGSDFNMRVAPGYNEIVPLTTPVNAWKENVFRAKFVDADGKPIKNARVDVNFINAKIDLAKNTYRGGEEMEKSSVRVFTDDNGIFAFTPSRAGQWVIRAIADMDRANKKVKDATMVVQFE